MEGAQVAVITVTVQEWNETKGMIKNICDAMSKLTAQEEKELLTPNEVCAMLKIGRTTYQRYVASGVLEPIKVNRQKYSKAYVKRSDIERLINEGKV
jgi:predicted site-specific integrase-resolvase